MLPIGCSAQIQYIGCLTGPWASRHQPRKTDSARELFLSSLQIVTLDFNTLPESLHPIKKSRMQDPFFNTPQKSINGHEKLRCRLE
jgi:hypothetical protein